MKRHFFFDQINLDAIGFSTSAVCAIHCFATPFLITLLPVIGLGFFVQPIFETSLIIFGLIIGTLSLSHGFLKHHHNFMPIVCLLLGFGLIVLGHLDFFTQYEFILISIGAATIALSHLMNLKLMKHEKECSH